MSHANFSLWKLVARANIEKQKISCLDTTVKQHMYDPLQSKDLGLELILSTLNHYLQAGKGRPFPSSPVPKFQVRNHSCENDFDLHENEPVGGNSHLDSF